MICDQLGRRGQFGWDIQQADNVLSLKPCGGYIVFVLLLSLLKLNTKIDHLYILYFIL